MKSGLIQELSDAIGSANVISGEGLNERYIHIWKMDQPLLAVAAVLPRSTEHVSAVMKICFAYDQKVVVHGGLTNLVGSTETDGDEVVISLEKLNQIEELDEKSRTITAQAGVILEQVQLACSEKELLFPLNFGAKGSAQIGGVISTNAGGLRVFKYGMTRNLVLGLEVVLADGTIISSLKKIIKDNSAYDLKHMFIGSEGTLGIITKAVLKLSEAPKSRTSAFVAIDDYEHVISFLKHMDSGLAGTLSGYELIWGHTYKVMTTPPAQMRPPIPHGHSYYVLLESHGADVEKDTAVMEALLESALEKGLIEDAAIASNEADLTWFWTIREDVHVFVSQANHDQHFDISLPLPLIGNVLERISKNLYELPDVEVVFIFGHVADGNIHLVVGKRIQSDELIHAINEVIYSELQPIGGSISAEHGIGNHKKAYLHYSRSTAEIELMKTLKKSLDPKLLLNRGKVIDV